MTKKVFFNDKVIFFTTDNHNFPENEPLIIVPVHSYKQFNYLFLQLAIIDAPMVIMFYFDTKETMKEIIKNYFVRIEAAGGLVKNQFDNYLIIRRWDKWDLPKGKTEENESSKQAALREVSEETGIKELEIIKKLCNTYHIYKHNETWIIKKTHWFKMQTTGDELLQPQINEDITEAAWFEIDRLKEVYKNTYRSLLEVFESAGLKKVK
jgi:ADP-ribose pyrophosphatase YjhB (NUDIX family)